MHGQRSHKGLAKRVTITRNGQVKYKKAGGGHRKAKHTAKQNQQLRSPKVAPEVERKRVQAMLGFKIRRPSPATPSATTTTENTEE